MTDIADLMAACDALDAVAPDDSQRRQHTARLREGLAQLADEIHDLRAQRESLEGQVMALANEEPPAATKWEHVLILLEDDESDFDPAA